jgi:DNA-binding transcriptional MerR regulator
VSASARFLNPAAAAQRLGVSAKALRLYEQRGLITPSRTAAGWRAYGPDEMARAAEIVALRALGFSLAQIARVLGDDPQGLEPALAAHQAILEGRIRQLAGAVEKVRDLRAGLAQGKSPTAGELVRLLGPTAAFSVAFDLPWPWGGERFELSDVRPLNYIIGPLGSGKTRLAKRLAETLPNAVFLGLDRLEHGGAAARAHLDADRHSSPGSIGPWLGSLKTVLQRRRPLSPFLSDWNPKARPSWLSTWWNRGWTRPHRKP